MLRIGSYWFSIEIPTILTIFLEPLTQVTSMLGIRSWFSIEIPIIPNRFLFFDHISRTIGPSYFHVMNKKLLVFHKDSYNSNNSLFCKLVPKE
jgi:hypothetical protein